MLTLLGGFPTGPYTKHASKPFYSKEGPTRNLSVQYPKAVRQWGGKYQLEVTLDLRGNSQS